MAASSAGGTRISEPYYSKHVVSFRVKLSHFKHKNCSYFSWSLLRLRNVPYVVTWDKIFHSLVAYKMILYSFLRFIYCVWTSFPRGLKYDFAILDLNQLFPYSVIWARFDIDYFFHIVKCTHDLIKRQVCNY